MAAALSHAPSLSRRFFAVLLAVSAAAVVIAFVASVLLFQASGEADVRAALDRECDLIASALNVSNGDDDVAIVRSLDLGGMRATLIDAEGNVLMDSDGNPEDMESHANRPEVQEAMVDGEGSSERLSNTLDIVSFYHAKRLASGGVIRVAQDSRTAFAVITGDLSALAMVAIIIIALSWLVARIISRVLVAPILAIDVHGGRRDLVVEDDAHTTSPYHELEPLVERLNKQQAKLVEQMDQLRDAEVMRQEFTANITHELKTPLAVISGAAELIRDGIARPEDVPNFAGRIYDESQRLTSLVNDILILSRLDESERAGMPDLVGSFEPCDLHSIAQDVCSRLAPMAKRGNVSLGCVGMPAPVMGNARLLDELIYNLCSNAIRYNRENGSVLVTCGLGDPDAFEEGNGITNGAMSVANGASAANAAQPPSDITTANTSLQPFVRVADTGIGIERAEQAKVFERFYRVDTSRSRNGGGTGLGLAIVKHSAAFHHATIDLDSTPGEGTVITVTFPPMATYRDGSSEGANTENHEAIQRDDDSRDNA